MTEICGEDSDVPRLQVETFSGDVGDALYVTKNHVYVDGKWAEREGWRITHAPTGKALGPNTLATRDEALALLARCDPEFPAWPLATDLPDCAATKACAYKFRVAVGAPV